MKFGEAGQAIVTVPPWLGLPCGPEPPLPVDPDEPEHAATASDSTKAAARAQRQRMRIRSSPSASRPPITYLTYRLSRVLELHHHLFRFAVNTAVSQLSLVSPGFRRTVSERDPARRTNRAERA